ncbi:MAG: NADPH-dependent FMN reductase [Pseudomonadota bacterium]
MKIIALSGSLRRLSFNSALLRATAALAAPVMDITIYPGIGDLPHFNPDIEADAEGNPPAIAADFRAQVAAADGVLIACPEYAHGVPGAFKNALDWLVGSQIIGAKPVALFNAAPRASHAQAALAEIITVMGWDIVAEASIALPPSGKNLDQAGLLANQEICDLLRAAMAAFAEGIVQRRL